MWFRRRPLPMNSSPAAGILSSISAKFLPRWPAWSMAVYPARSAGRSLETCRWPMGDAHFPSTWWSTRQLTWVLRLPPRTAGDSVAKILSLSCPARPHPRVALWLPPPCHPWCPLVSAPGGGQVTSLISLWLVFRPPGAWSATPPSPGPPSLYTGPPAGGPRSSPSKLSTSPQYRASQPSEHEYMEDQRPYFLWVFREGQKNQILCVLPSSIMS